jgi:hypothetical protein
LPMTQTNTAERGTTT